MHVFEAERRRWAAPRERCAFARKKGERGGKKTLGRAERERERERERGREREMHGFEAEKRRWTAPRERCAFARKKGERGGKKTLGRAKREMHGFEAGKRRWAAPRERRVCSKKREREAERKRWVAPGEREMHGFEAGKRRWAAPREKMRVCSEKGERERGAESNARFLKKERQKENTGSRRGGEMHVFLGKERETAG